MPGIQTRGRNRITTNKIEQDKVIATQPQNIIVKESQPLPSSSKLEQSTQNQIQSTESNIEQAVRAKKIKHMVKHRTDDDPASKVMLGMGNTGSDYANILNSEYEDKSILNQAIGHAFEGKWDKAGQVIQENPYRFAGNLAVEVASNFIPFAAVTKVAKIAKFTTKVREGTVNKITKVINNRLSDDVITPEGYTRLYQITNNRGSSWFSLKQPHEWYAKRVTTLNDASTFGKKKNQYAGIREEDAIDLRKEGIEMGDARPELRAIDVKDADVTNYNVGQLIEDSGINKKLKQEWIPPSSNPNQQPTRELLQGLPDDFVPITNTPGKLGTSAATDFFNYPDAVGKPVGRYLKESTLDPLSEWVFPLSYQKNVKILAKQKETEPFINRLFNPYLTKDKMANKLVKMVQTNKEKKLRDENYYQMNPGTQNTSFGLADDQLRRLDDIHEADVMAKEIKIRFPKENKDYRPLSAGFLTPFAISTTSKGQAAAGGFTKKFNNKNKQSFAGY
jgi:hypothetical protein